MSSLCLQSFCWHVTPTTKWEIVKLQKCQTTTNWACRAASARSWASPRSARWTPTRSCWQTPSQTRSQVWTQIKHRIFNFCKNIFIQKKWRFSNTPCLARPRIKKLMLKKTKTADLLNYVLGPWNKPWFDPRMGRFWEINNLWIFSFLSVGTHTIFQIKSDHTNSLALKCRYF